MTPEPCQHDYAKPVRKGRAHYVCRKCWADISLEVFMLAAADNEEEKEKK